MEIVLIQDVKDLGFKADILTVKNGYARNYLIPKKYAEILTPRRKKILAENAKQQARKDRIELQKSEETAEKVRALDIILRARLVDSRKKKIYGSITDSDIASKFAEHNLLIDKKYISIVGDAPKETGKYQATLRLHRKLTIEFFFTITAA